MVIPTDLAGKKNGWARLGQIDPRVTPSTVLGIGKGSIANKKIFVLLGW